MDFSIVIPSYQGVKRLPIVLGALEKQSLRPKEVIVSLDGSYDGSLELLTNWATMPELKVISHENGGRSMARNKGVKAAQYSTVLFLDDDILLSPTSLKHLVEKYHDLDEATIVTGRCNLKSSGGVVDRFRIYSENQLDRRYSDIEEIDEDNYRFSSTILLVKKNWFERIGGLDQRLNDSEDFDLFIRARLGGTKVLFDKKIHGLHLDSRTMEELIQRKVEYWKGRNILQSIHPEYVRLMPDHFKKYTVTGTKLALMKLAKFGIFWRLVVKSGILSLLPDKSIYAILSRIEYASVYLITAQQTK